MKKKDVEREKALSHLREMLPPGSTVYTVLRHVSRYGMEHIGAARMGMFNPTREEYRAGYSLNHEWI